MKKKLKRNQIIQVHWMDQSYYNGPTEADGAMQPATGYSVGHFIEENETWLCISAEKFETDRVNYRQIMTFPKVCILRIELLKH